jgi:peptide-methionine (S)-S-oxide reductase
MAQEKDSANQGAYKAMSTDTPPTHSRWKPSLWLKLFVGLLAVAVIGLAVLHFLPISPRENFPVPDSEEAYVGGGENETATFASGCFWCTEAMFQQLKGVEKVVSGYSGGTVENPTYQQVCSGKTGHAESVQVTFDPRLITYQELLEVFWRMHNPTTENRQGNDVGTQYRSVIFYHSDRQRELAERYRRKIDEAHIFSNPLVTEIVPFAAFYPAEDHHQNFYANNPGHPYCQMLIEPKVKKLKQVFQDKLRTD